MTVENQEAEELKQLRLLLEIKNRQVEEMKHLFFKMRALFEECCERLKQIEESR